MLELAQSPARNRGAMKAPADVQRTLRPEHRYYAFLSYSHKDEAIAEWLHRELEQFRVPQVLAGKLAGNGVIPRRLTPIFRDRHELAAATDLGAEIKAALASAQYLVVLCSPDAAKSRWTNAEIEVFKRARPDGCVLAAIVAGEPFASDFAGREEEECFPPALREKYDRRGRPTGKRAEPLASDLREAGDGRRRGLLKLVAGMLGVGLDELVQRETTQRHRRLAYLAAALLAGMAVTSTLAVTAIQSRDAAQEQRREAEGLVGFMLGDLKDKLEPIGRLDALDAVGGRALAYYQRQDKSELSDQALAQRAQALTMIGEIANTRGDLDGALKRYREALASTAEAARRYPDEPQRLFDHAQNIYWVGYIDYQRGRLNEATAKFRQYQLMADKMVALAPDEKKYRLEQVYANINLGTVLMDLRRYRPAAATYQASMTAAEVLAAAEPRNRDYQNQVSDSLAWLADAHEYSGALEPALAERERQLKLLRNLEIGDPRDTGLQRTIMTARRSIGRLLASLGQVDEGLSQMQASVAISDTLFGIEPENTEWLQANAAGRFDLAELQLGLGRAPQAAATVRAYCDLSDRLLLKDSSVSAWRSRLQSGCLELRARVAVAAGESAPALLLAERSAEVARTSPDTVERAMLSFRALAAVSRVQTALGHNGEAAAAARQALATVPGGMALRPREMAEAAMLQLRIGNRREAERLTARLTTIGYRYPGSRLVA